MEKMIGLMYGSYIYVWIDLDFETSRHGFLD